MQPKEPSSSPCPQDSLPYSDTDNGSEYCYCLAHGKRIRSHGGSFVEVQGPVCILYDREQAPGRPAFTVAEATFMASDWPAVCT